MFDYNRMLLEQQLYLPFPDREIAQIEVGHRGEDTPVAGRFDAWYRLNRWLPSPVVVSSMSLFRIRRRRPLQKSLRHLFTVLVERTEKELAVCPPLPAAIHEARKSVKRLRALVSLVASGMGDEADRFDHTLRDINRALSATRDATVALATLDGLAVAAGNGLATDFSVCRAALDRRLARVSEREIDVSRDVVFPLRRLQQQWKKWSWGEDEWDILEPNLRRIFREGRRKSRQIADGAPPEALHDLRKLVKGTQYHLEFLTPIAPQRLQAEHDEWERLADVLGNHHDLWVLEELIRTTSARQLPRAARSLILGEVRAGARKLERQAEQLAPILYAERPRALSDRLAVYWHHWRTHDGS